MASKSFRNQFTVLVLFLASLFVQVYCLDNLQVFAINTREQSCIGNSRDNDLRERWCGNYSILMYPNVTTAVQDKKICFADTGQDPFTDNVDDNMESMKILNLTGCGILQQEEIKNISCKWLERLRANKTMDKGDVLKLVILVCGSRERTQQKICLVLENSHKLSDINEDSTDTCLFQEARSTTSPNADSSDLWLDKLKKYEIPIIASLAGALFIVVIILANACYKNYKSDRSRPNDFESSDAIPHSQESQPNPSEGDCNIGVYHEPTFQTQNHDVSTETSSIDYEYAYGHLNGAKREEDSGEREETRSYVNIRRISASGHQVETLDTGISEHSAQQLSGQNNEGEDDYVNTHNDSFNLHNVSYTSLNLLGMVDDTHVYQGLVPKKATIRPKVAPKPVKSQDRGGQADTCYVKVL